MQGGIGVVLQILDKAGVLAGPAVFILSYILP